MIANPIWEALNDALEKLAEIDKPYTATPEEAEFLQAALVNLITVFDMRDFAPGEEAVWNCGAITMGGQDRGAWEIKLRQTDAPKPDLNRSSKG